MSAFLLTVKKTIAANRKAYAEKRLGAQHKSCMEQCLYDYGNNIRCAIGVALPKTLCRRLVVEERNDLPVTTLIETVDVRVPTALEGWLLRSIQIVHDAWTGATKEFPERIMEDGEPHSELAGSRLGDWLWKQRGKKITGQRYLKMLDEIERFVESLPKKKAGRQGVS